MTDNDIKYTKATWQKNGKKYTIWGSLYELLQRMLKLQNQSNFDWVHEVKALKLVQNTQDVTNTSMVTQDDKKNTFVQCCSIS